MLAIFSELPEALQLFGPGFKIEDTIQLFSAAKVKFSPVRKLHAFDDRPVSMEIEWDNPVLL